MARGQRPSAGVGCLTVVVGALVVGVIITVVAVVGLVALAVVAALLVVGAIALFLDRVLLALSPKRRERRERRADRTDVFVWRSGAGPTGGVIDTTAIETSAPVDDPGRHGTEGDDDPAG